MRVHASNLVVSVQPCCEHGEVPYLWLSVKLRDAGVNAMHLHVAIAKIHRQRSSQLPSLLRENEGLTVCGDPHYFGALTLQYCVARS